MSKVCDSCRSHCALVYCSADMAYLCIECDLKVHRANKVASRHDRVWVCEVCEHAPAAVICKADAAALCHACDRDIHSANPLASRHERVPVVPFFECPGMVKVAHVNASVHSFEHLEEGFLHNKNLEHPGGMKTKSAAENFIDFSQGFEEAPISLSVPEVLRHYASLTSSKNDHGSPNSLGSLNSLSHNSMSSSPLLGVVPDTSLNDISKPCYYERNDYISQLEPIAREARVLRYKEKRKNRKFEKTVRYASRKAYAEIRPRVKGRFVKRSEVDEGIVPSI